MPLPKRRRAQQVQTHRPALQVQVVRLVAALRPGPLALNIRLRPEEPQVQAAAVMAALQVQTAKLAALMAQVVGQVDVLRAAARARLAASSLFTPGSLMDPEPARALV